MAGIKLDIACGQTKIAPDWVGIDLYAESADIRHDLTIYPWPIETGSVEQAHCSHYIEHVPLADGIDADGRKRDHLLMFFDELYRILAPGAQVRIIAPYYAGMRAWQDPTHRRAISEATFLYANRDWRVANGLDHYPVSCDFDFAYAYAMSQAWAMRAQEARDFALAHYINVAQDIDVTLTKRG
ncbi:MAG: hypothetical protein RJB26_2150 [Pseudomonadota bacterium]